MTKERVSLTLDGRLLERADRLVGELADSRSAVFEKLLEKAFLSMTPKTAVILAGTGEGFLLEEFGGRKLVDRHLENLELAGVNRFVFVGKGMGELRDYLGDRKGRFAFVTDEGQGTAGALRRAGGELEKTFFLVYGDTISSLDYQDLYRFHADQGLMATVALTTWKEPHRMGVPEIKGTRITGFREKPPKADSYLVSSGSFVMEPSVLDFVPARASSLERDVLPELVDKGQVAGYIFSGGWMDVGKVSEQSSSSQGSE